MKTGQEEELFENLQLGAILPGPGFNLEIRPLDLSGGHDISRFYEFPYYPSINNIVTNNKNNLKIILIKDFCAICGGMVSLGIIVTNNKNNRRFLQRNRECLRE